MAVIQKQRVQNADGSITEFDVKVLDRRGGVGLAVPAPAPVIEVAIAEAEPVAESN